MINNINNDINRFDGKYLKCVVSKYPSVLKFLANSGSMIVLQPQNELINQDIVETISNGKYKINIKNSESKQRNYIYLGDEFLASGYGFTTIQYRNTGERIIKTYDATIDRLDEADATEKETREKKDKEIMEEFKKYVAINGGPIENTVVNFDGDGTKRIRTRDIILYGEEAQYIDLSVENIIITLYDHNGYAYKAENNQCIFPFGGIVTSIAIEIIGKDNDSGGLNYLEVLHDFHHKNTNYDEREGIIIKYDTDVDNKVVIEDNIDPIYNTHKWFYYKQLSNSSLTKLIIDEEKNNVIKDIYLYVKETPETNYKFYPGLLNCKYLDINNNVTNERVELKSSGNAIKNHKLNLNTKLDIKPQYYIMYNFELPLLVNNFNDNNICPLNMIDDDYTTKVNILLNHNSNTSYKYVQIAVPINFALRKFYLIKNNLEQFNLTGAIYKVKSNVSLPCPKSKIPNSSTDKYYCMKYGVYMFMSNNPIASDTNICLEVVYDGKSSLDVTQETESELTQDFNNNNISELELINDEGFNNLYWLNGGGDDKDILAKKLNKTQENGIVKPIKSEQQS